MLNDFKNYLKLNIDTENSRLQYYLRLKLFFSKYNNFNQENINSFLANCVDNNLKPSTFNGYLIALKHYATFLKLDITFPEMKKLNKGTERVFVTKKELEEEIFPYFPLLFPSDYKKRKLILRFMFLTGLRISEVINLKKENINFITKEIIVKDTKGKTDRKVYIHPIISEAIKNEFNKHKNIENAFNITKEYIIYIFKKINEELNYKKKNITPHSIRHSGAKFLLKNNMPINEVMLFLGHKNVKTTMIYLHANEKEVKDTYFSKIKYNIKKGDGYVSI